MGKIPIGHKYPLENSHHTATCQPLAHHHDDDFFIGVRKGSNLLESHPAGESLVARAALLLTVLLLVLNGVEHFQEGRLHGLLLEAWRCRAAVGGTGNSNLNGAT